MEVAVERVATAAEAATSAGITLTARAENHLYGIDDLEDTIARLIAYHHAGAHVVYAPGLADIDQIRRVVVGTGAAANVLATADGPNVAQLRDAGVRRISTGGALAFAYGALAAAGRQLLSAGSSTYIRHALSPEDRRAAFDG